MASKRVLVDQQTISCVICLDVLKDPVTIPCGHSYCMGCIKTHWDEEDKGQIHSCPQCRQTFTQRPVLVKNTTLAILIEELKKTGLQAAPADHCYAGPLDVACDICTGRKLRAYRSCLVCLASYCGTHLKPHFGPAFKKHKLAEPSKTLQGKICSHHDEVMKMFCRTDQKFICYVCSEDEHSLHDTVTAVAERTERQRELEVTRQNIQQRLQDREKDRQVLQQEVEAINRSADIAVEDSKKTIAELIIFIQKRGSDLEQQIRSKQSAAVSRVKELQEKLDQEITELTRKDAKLEQLSHDQDHNQFIQNYSTLSPLSESTDAPSINIRSPSYFDNMTAAVSDMKDRVQDFLGEQWANITVNEADVLLSQPQPRTRAELLKYARVLTLEQNSVSTDLLLSEGNRKASSAGGRQPYPPHPERFLYWSQGLSRQSLTGRCYWEVEWTGEVDYVAVSYFDISRDHDANESGFGYNDKSWALYGYGNNYTFMHKGDSINVSGPWSYRIGVYLDHSAGILYFFSVSETVTLLYRVQTKFTQPLFAGFGIDYGESAEFCLLT